MKLPSFVDDLISRIPLANKIPGGPGEKVLLELDLGRGISESAPTNPLEAIRALRTPQLRTLIEHLHRAETDDSVVGLIGILHGGGLTLSQSAELRAAVRSFRASGKPAFAFSPGFGEASEGNVGYHLACAFEQIWLQPASGVGLTGFAASASFLRGAFDKVGVEPEFGQRYEYKSAADTFTRTGFTEANREMTERLVESLTEQVVADVAADRGVDSAAVTTAMAAAPLTPEDAVERGLVDQIGYRDEAYAAIRARLGVPEPTLRYVERQGTTRLSGLLESLPKAGGGPKIALIEAVGPINVGYAKPGAMGGRSIGSDSLGTALRAAAKDDDVKAVVLRIDSPGGSAVASDSIRRDIQQVQLVGKPVVASMASVAASGGYYIAMPCDRILASPGTITGSIGVLAGKFVIRQVLEKVGVGHELIAGSPRAAMFSATAPFSKEEWAVLDAWLDRIYDDFTAKAAADRGMEVEELRAVARGRVWTGADACARGLVDQLGGLGDAIDQACALIEAERGDVRVVSYPKPHPLAAFQPPESSESVAAASVSAGLPGLSAGLGEGPVVWQAMQAVLSQSLGWPGLGWQGAGVLSLPPIRVAGVLPTAW